MRVPMLSGSGGSDLPVRISDPSDLSGLTLLVGASGQVGAQILRALGDEHTAVTARSGGSRASSGLELDLAELGGVAEAEQRLAEVRPDRVFCIGGMTNVEACEDVPEAAFRTNARGPGFLAGYAWNRRVPFVYVSTEYVFDGSDDRPGPYIEEDQTHPLSVYGQSKLAGEERVLAEHPEALILRTTVVYGPDAQAKNYLYSVVRNLRAGRRMRVPADQISTPTYNRDFVRATCALVAAGATGIYHVCGPQMFGRLEFAREIARLLGLNADLLEGVATAELGQRAPRPLRAGLRTEKLRRDRPEIAMRTVGESLRDCAADLEAFVREAS